MAISQLPLLVAFGVSLISLTICCYVLYMRLERLERKVNERK